MKMIYQKIKAGVLLMAVFVILFTGILYFTGGVTSGSNLVLVQKAGKHTKQTEELYSLKVTNASDTQKIYELLCHVIDETFQYRGFEGNTEPFAFSVEGGQLRIQYTQSIVRPDSFQRLTGDYSALFLALIPDIEKVIWQYPEIQYGGSSQTKTLEYDWSMMQQEDFIDSNICKITKGYTAKDFGANVSVLQSLIEHFTYYDKGKLPNEKKPSLEIDEKKIQKQLMSMPDSYEEAAKSPDICVEASDYVSSKKKEDYHMELWDSFCQKVKKGEAATIIIAGYNSLENVELNQHGSVFYTYVCYDGVWYHILNDFVNSDGTHDFDGMSSGNYLLESDCDINDIPMTTYYVSNDASVSWRDFMYSSLYAGINETVPIDSVSVNSVLTIYR